MQRNTQPHVLRGKYTLITPSKAAGPLNLPFIGTSKMINLTDNRACIERRERRHALP